MKNKANKYRVTYTSYDEQGWPEEHHKDVSELSEILRYEDSKIVSVVPIFIEFGKPLSNATIQKVLVDARECDKQKRKAKHIKRLRQELKEALTK